VRPMPLCNGRVNGRDRGQRWPLSVVLLLLWCTIPLARVAQAASTSLTLPAYQEKLILWQSTLAQADGADQVAAVQRAAAAVDQIVLPTGTVVTLQPLLGDPAQGTIDLATAQMRLASVIHELAATDKDDTAARLLLLTAIFQRPEFVEQDSLWQRFWRWLRAWLPTLPNTENSATPASPLFVWLGWALVGIAVALLIWLLSYWLQNLLGAFITGAEQRASDAEAGIPQTAAAARKAAHQLADTGSYREAVRHLYLSALLALHERHLINYQPSDTNREVLSAVRPQSPLYQQLQPVVETFDDVWYGVHEPDRASFDSYVIAVEKLEEVK
jgi:hypothetical protein